MPKQHITSATEPTTPSPYEIECLQGRALAAALIDEVVESGKTYLLGWKMGAIALEPRSGVQVGFAAYLADKLIEGEARE